MRRTLALLAALFACGVLAGAFAVGPAAAQSGANTIENCTVVDEPGHYDLAGDVSTNGSGACIEVQSSDVTIDGDGAAIQGPGPSGDDGDASSGAGVLVNGSAAESYENVTVEDLSVSGFDAGVQAGTGGFGDATAVAVVDVEVADTDRGVELRGGNATLSGVTVEDSEYGVYAIESGDLEAFHVTLRNDGHGLEAAETGAIYLESTDVRDNDGTGIGVGPSVSLDTYDVDVTGNGGFGVAATDHGTSVHLSHSSVSDNDDAGLTVRGEAEARLDEVEVSGNGADGVRTRAGGEVTLFDVAAGDNAGLELDARDGNATARRFQIGPTTNVSLNSRSVALEPVAHGDLPAAPENRTLLGDGVNATGSEGPVGMTFDVDTDAETAEVWRHDGVDWTRIGETEVDNGTVTKFSSDDGVFAVALEGDETGSDDEAPTPTPTETESETGSSGSGGSSGSSGGSDGGSSGEGSFDDSGGLLDTDTPTPTPTATATATATATDDEDDSNDTDDGTETDDGTAGGDEVDGTDDDVEEESGFAIGDGPGFGAIVAILALLATALLAHRRH